MLLSESSVWHLIPDFSGRLFGKGADPILAMWFLSWVPHSLAHGLNPFFSHAIFVPVGVNLAQNTQAPLLGLLTAPFAVFLGPVARANLLMILAMPASATAAFVVLRKWRVWLPAAALGGLIYGFSPYAVGQALGHVVLSSAAPTLHRLRCRLDIPATRFSANVSVSFSASCSLPSSCPSRRSSQHSSSLSAGRFSVWLFATREELAKSQGMRPSLSLLLSEW